MTDHQILHAIRVAVWRGTITEAELIVALAKLAHPTLIKLNEPQTRREGITSE
jgi:hypothetical protein